MAEKQFSPESSSGLFLTAIVAVLTFVAHRKLPYKKMLVLTGVLLGGVLLVMVGEQVQEMQLAHWLPSTEIHWLAPDIPDWMGLWFSVFPNAESLTRQGIAFVLVAVFYFVASRPGKQVSAQLTATPPMNLRLTQPRRS